MQVRKQLPNYEDLLRNFVTSKAVKPCADQFISSTCLSEGKKILTGFPTYYQNLHLCLRVDLES